MNQIAAKFVQFQEPKIFQHKTGKINAAKPFLTEAVF